MKADRTSDVTAVAVKCMLFHVVSFTDINAHFPKHTHTLFDAQSKSRKQTQASNHTLHGTTHQMRYILHLCRF